MIDANPPSSGTQIHPIGCTIIAVTKVGPDLMQVRYSAVDIINKVGAGAVVYVAGAHILERRIDSQSREYALHVD